jgi:hypothetical protein
MASAYQPEITIRLAKENDAELVADLSRQTFYESFAQVIQKRTWINL